MLHPQKVRRPIVPLVPVPMVDVVAARELPLSRAVDHPMRVLVAVAFRFEPDAIPGHCPLAHPGQPDARSRWFPPPSHNSPRLRIEYRESGLRHRHTLQVTLTGLRVDKIPREIRLPQKVRSKPRR